MRVVFDVNVLTRVTLGSELAARALRRTLELGGDVLVSDTLLAELAETVSKRRLAPHVQPELYAQLVASLNENGDPVDFAPPLPTCRDPDDAYLLGMARDGRADFLVTGDNDLLSLGSIGDCRIVRPEVFASIVDQRDASGA